jgi:hypothetical protein
VDPYTLQSSRALTASMVIGDVLGEPDGEAGAHGVQPPSRPVGMLQDGARHVGHAVVDGAALALQQLQRLAGLEALLQHRAAAVGEDGGQRIGRAEGPEEGHRPARADLRQ